MRLLRSSKLVISAVLLWSSSCFASPVRGTTKAALVWSQHHHHTPEYVEALQTQERNSREWQLRETETTLQQFGIPMDLLRTLRPAELAEMLYLPDHYMDRIHKDSRQAVSLKISTYLGLYHNAAFRDAFSAARDRIKSRLHKRIRRTLKVEQEASYREEQASDEAGAEQEAVCLQARRRRTTREERAHAGKKGHPIAQLEAFMKMELRSSILDELRKFRINLDRFDDPVALATEMEKPGGLMWHVPEDEVSIVSSRIGDYIEYRKDREYRQRWSRSRGRLHIQLNGDRSASRKARLPARKEAASHRLSNSNESHQKEHVLSESQHGRDRQPASVSASGLVYDPNFRLEDLDAGSHDDDMDLGFQWNEVFHSPSNDLSGQSINQGSPAETPSYRSPPVEAHLPYQDLPQELEEMHYLLGSPEPPQLWR